MQAATDSATIELRRRATSPLSTANQDGQPLNFSIQQESDISGELCGSDVHSPTSENSSGYSEKMFSPSDSNRNNSDISEGCPSPFEKEARISDSELTPEKRSANELKPAVTQGRDGSESLTLDKDVALRDHSEGDQQKEREKRRNGTTEYVHDVNDNDDADDQKQMEDIVGDATSPGEFLQNALKFIKNGRKEDHRYWPVTNRKKSRSGQDLELDNETPSPKRLKPCDGRGQESPLYGLNRQMHRYYKDDGCEVKKDQTRGINNVLLTPDQKFFVEAFKQEVANAAESAAEASALRVLEILESSGIYFGRSPFQKNRGTPKSLWERKRPTDSSSPISEIKQSRDEKHNGFMKSPSGMVAGTSFSEDKDGQIRTSNRSQMCFGSVRLNDDRNFKSNSQDDTIDLTSIGRKRNSSELSCDSKRKGIDYRESDVETADADQQSQALSLVTKRSRSPATTPPLREKSTHISVAQTKSSSCGSSALLSPFVRQSMASEKSRFIPSSYASHFENPISPLTKYFPRGVGDVSDKRDRILRDDQTDYSPFPFSPVPPLKVKNPLKSRVSPLYKDDKRLSPRRDDKNLRPDLVLPTSFGMHGVPGNSAFSRHGSQRSPSAGGMRSLRNSGSPDHKPFPPPATQLLYPSFGALPFLPSLHQNPHFAASLLATMNQRRNVPSDFNDVRRGPSLHGDRIHQSLRGHPAPYMNDPHGYDAEGSNLIFPNNMQEGLTPQHLKKAKLIFFYTRYPNANTLKTYFPDVNFTRAITSQLIKWFSNFREFFYIQMEKFARQAVTDGVVDASMLRVTRDSELFRVLNLHYNKCNEFYVPETFVSAAEASQREFFLAVKAGKDSDPAWKKVIYKIICKLDCEIPELFKLPNVLDRLHEIRD